MQIASELLDEMIAHALRDAPNECCGVVAVAKGDDGESTRAVTVHAAVNTAASPLRFEIDGREVLSLIEAIDAEGLELGAIYHSHTRTAPYPSQTDINFAAGWPGIQWVIIGVSDREQPEVRTYLIDGPVVTETATG